VKTASMILGGLLVLGIASSAQAASISKPGAEAAPPPPPKSALLSGDDVDAIYNLAGTFGEASLEKQKNGDPKIIGKVGDLQYAVFFMNCTDNAACEDLNFYAGYKDMHPETDVINSWNRDKRFGKAYLDKVGDAVVEMDLNLEHGVSAENLTADFTVWTLVIQQFSEYIGYTAAQ
jgi:hypothetical protein